MSEHTKDKPQCCERVREQGVWPNYHQCTRNGVVERDGKHYCKQHDPDTSAAKRAAVNAEWSRRDRETRERQARVDACINACRAIPTADLANGVVPVEVVRRLVDSLELMLQLIDETGGADACSNGVIGNNGTDEGVVRAFEDMEEARQAIAAAEQFTRKADE
jgi:hypothetical protein